MARAKKSIESFLRAFCPILLVYVVTEFPDHFLGFEGRKVTSGNPIQSLLRAASLAENLLRRAAQYLQMSVYSFLK